MTLTSPLAAASVPAPLLAIGAMGILQLGVALSVPLIESVGAATTTWVRLTWAALILVLIARPRLLGRPAAELLPAMALGAVSAAMTLFYFEAVARLPIGTVTTLEFMGPLGVALLGARRLQDVAWAALAGLGVVLLVGGHLGEPGDRVGLAYTFAAALCWATYILLTKRVGKAFAGLEGLSVSFLVAAAVSLPFGVQNAAALDLTAIFAALGLALLLPLMPYALEMAALRRMSASSFGVLLSLEPAISALLALAILGQKLGAAAVLGVACVTVASIGAVRASRVPVTQDVAT